MPIMNIAAAFGAMVGVGAGARISLRLGEGNKAAAEKTLCNAVILNVIIGFTIMALMLTFLDEILVLFSGGRASAETLAYGNYEVRLEQVELSCLGKIVSQDGTYTGKIIVAAPTAVCEATANAAASEVEIYGTNGIRQSALRPGINIVKGVNGGKARAVTVK